jgi:hypothetical protein
VSGLMFVFMVMIVSIAGGIKVAGGFKIKF